SCAERKGVAMDIGRFVLHRFNGDEEFRLKAATMLALKSDDDEGVWLWFEAETDGVPVKTLPDTKDLYGHPKAEAAVVLKSLDLDRLAGARFSVPQAYDEDKEEHLAHIYYVEHEDLDNNEIEVVARTGDEFHVRWYATTMDVNYSDGSKADTRIE